MSLAEIEVGAGTRLLQTEIDVVPNEQPNLKTLEEGHVGRGSAVVEIVNAGELENAYTLRIECDHAYWQPIWAKFVPLDPVDEGDRPPSGKPDMRGPNNATVRLHLGRGAKRRVMITFRVPEKSEARAGLYKLRVVVETAVPEGTPAIVLPATVIVRPYQSFSAEAEPAQRRTGLLRRRARYTVRVVNRGNDWLYVDLKPTKSVQATLDLPSARLAVPPPEPGETSDRTLPVVATVKLRTPRGDAVDVPLPFEIVRVDAPSVPPLGEGSDDGGPALVGAAVVASETAERAAFEEAPLLRYHPPIPATLTGFLQALVRNVKGLLLAAVGLIALFTMGAIVFERWQHQISSFSVYSATTDKDGKYAIPNGGSFTLRGEWLDRARIELYTKDGAEPAETLDSDDAQQVKLQQDKKVRSGLALSGRAKDALKHMYLATVTPTLKDTTIVRIVARRKMPILGSLGIFEPARIDKTPITIGAVEMAEEPSEWSVAFQELLPNQEITILGKNIGGPGEIRVGETVVKPAKWTDTEIKIPVPTELRDSGQTFNIQVNRKGKASKTLEGFHVKKDEIEVPPGGTTAGQVAIDGRGGPGATGGPEPVLGSGPSATPGSGAPTAKAGPVATPPEGYDLALKALGSNKRADWESVLKATEGATDPERVALRFLAFASLPNRFDDADKLWTEFSKNPEPAGRAGVYIAVATSYLEANRDQRSKTELAAEVRKKLKAMDAIVAAHVKEADGGRPYGEGDALPYLVYAAFQKRTGLGTTTSALRKLEAGSVPLSDAEQKAADAMKDAP